MRSKYARVCATVLLIFGLWHIPLVAGADDSQKCKTTKEKIRKIQSKMRSGYTRAQGEKMEEQLRKLRKQRRKFCG
jgi:hypothetical protein